jgi:5-methylcytosine-specific restriction endonuclease McrA
MWSKVYVCCRDCQRTDAKHMADGLCVRCYLKQYRENPENKAHMAKQKRAWYRLHRAHELPKRKAYRERRNFSGLREAVLRRDGRQCVTCGARKKLVVHHRDGRGRGSNAANNRLSNLVTLCRACHLKEHRAELLRARRAKRTSPQLNKHGRWSQQFDACIMCREPYSKHAARGLCTRCYQRTDRKCNGEAQRSNGTPAAGASSRNRRAKGLRGRVHGRIVEARSAEAGPEDHQADR